LVDSPPNFGPALSSAALYMAVDFLCRVAPSERSANLVEAALGKAGVDQRKAMINRVHELSVDQPG
jgi:hypothetical protein